MRRALRAALPLRYLSAVPARFRKPYSDCLFPARDFSPLPPLPDFNVPFLRRRIALSTDLPAALPYLRREPFFLGMLYSSQSWSNRQSVRLLSERRCPPRHNSSFPGLSCCARPRQVPGSTWCRCGFGDAPATNRKDRSPLAATWPPNPQWLVLLAICSAMFHSQLQVMPC